jgi:hypothetical protein
LPANKRKETQWDLPSKGEENPVAKKSCTETENDQVHQNNEELLQQKDIRIKQRTYHFKRPQLRSQNRSNASLK